MKKERDSFFSQYGVNAYNQMPYMYPNMNNYNYGNNSSNTIENRISRLEQEIKSLEQRVSVLEGNTNSTGSTDYNFANSMYMV